MIFKEIMYDYKQNNYKQADHEEIPEEELWEDGELSSTQVQQKIIHHAFHKGDWFLVRRIEE